MTTEEITLIQQVAEKIRSDGGRMTAQRKLILEVLMTCTNHPTAEEIYTRALERDSTLHLSTVYRTLRWLEEEGFVSPRWFEGERRQERFDTVLDDNHDHYHFRCRLCNQIMEFPQPLIDQVKVSYEHQYGGRVENATLILYGICAQCQNVENAQYT